MRGIVKGFFLWPALAARGGRGSALLLLHLACGAVLLRRFGFAGGSFFLFVGVMATRTEDELLLCGLGSMRFGILERMLIYMIQRLLRRRAELLSRGVFMPRLSLAMVATPRSAACLSFFFLHAGGSSRISVWEFLPALPQVARSPAAAQGPGAGDRVNAVEKKTRDLIAFSLFVSGSFTVYFSQGDG